MLVGILGFGSIGMRHGRNLMDLGHQVIFHDPDVLGSVNRDWLIEQSDAVIIATPTKIHGPDLMDVLQAGKHVLVEKPIGYDCPPFIAGLITGAKTKKKDLVIATGFNLRFHDCVKKAKELVDSGLLGKVQGADFVVRQRNDKPAYLRDGVIRNWASHEIDLARHLLGNIYVEGCRTCSTDGNDETAVMDLIAIDADEASVRLIADYLTSPEVRKFTIEGSDGVIVCDLVKREVGWGLGWDDFSGKKDHQYIAADSFDDNYVDELRAFFNAIEGKDAGPLADGYDGVAALQVVMDAREKAGLK
jgi:predicted dehydrogenase